MPMPSAVWNYFTKVEGENLSICNICSRKIKCDNTTSGMMYHLLKVHKIVCQKVRRSKPTAATHFKKEPRTKRIIPKLEEIPEPQTITADDLSVCIVNQNDAEKKISDSNWLYLMDTMRHIIVDFCTSHPNALAPRFSSGGWCNGFRVTECNDQLSLEFLKEKIVELKQLWPGARLDIMRKADILMRQKAIIWIPPPEIGCEALQVMLRHQNPEIIPDDLTVLRLNEQCDEKGQSFLLDVGESAVSVIKTKERLNMGMDSVSVSLIPNCDKEENIEMQNGSEEIQLLVSSIKEEENWVENNAEVPI